MLNFRSENETINKNYLVFVVGLGIASSLHLYQKDNKELSNENINQVSINNEELI